MEVKFDYFFNALKEFEIDYEKDPPEYVLNDLQKFLKEYQLYPDLGIIEFTFLFLIGQFKVNDTDGTISVEELDKYSLKGIKIDTSCLIKIIKKELDKSKNPNFSINEFKINSKSVYNIIYSCKDIASNFVDDYSNPTIKKAIDFLYLPEVIKKIQYIHFIFNQNKSTHFIFNENNPETNSNDSENLDSLNETLKSLNKYRMKLLEIIRYLNEYDFENHTLYKELVCEIQEVFRKHYEIYCKNYNKMLNENCEKNCEENDNDNKD